MGVHFLRGFQVYFKSINSRIISKNKTQKVIAIVLAGQYPKAMIEKARLK